jgi:tetratricopeptide (TPR) repeat protein
MKLFFAFAIMTITGCASGTLSVETSPQKAELYARVPGSSDFRSLGPAPFIKSMSEVRSMLGRPNSVIIEARKEGYGSRSVFITDLDTSSDMKLNFDLLTNDKQASGESSEKHLLETNVLVDRLFDAQRMAQVGRLADATKQLEDLSKTFPFVAAIYELQGGIAYMQSDYPKALDSYNQALRNNPENLEVLQMRRFLEKKLKNDGRVPAGGK